MPSTHGFTIHWDIFIEAQQHRHVPRRVVPEAVQALDKFQHLFPVAAHIERSICTTREKTDIW